MLSHSNTSKKQGGFERKEKSPDVYTWNEGERRGRPLPEQIEEKGRIVIILYIYVCTTGSWDDAWDFIVTCYYINLVSDDITKSLFHKQMKSIYPSNVKSWLTLYGNHLPSFTPISSS